MRPEHRHDPTGTHHAATLDDTTLHNELVALIARMATDTHEMLVLVGERDHRALWAAAGSLSCAAWLAQLCDIETSTARTQVRVAAAMRKHPQLDQAPARGEISYAKARALLSHIDADNAVELIDIARRTPAGRLGQEIARWETRNNKPEEITDRQWQDRSVTRYTRPDEMMVTITVSPPETGAQTWAAIDAQITTTDAPAGASLAHQRHDAVAAIITGGASTVTAEMVIHPRDDANTLTDGTPISDRAAIGLLPDAFVSLLVHDTNHWPVDASPRRRPRCSGTASAPRTRAEPDGQDGRRHDAERTAA